MDFERGRIRGERESNQNRKKEKHQPKKIDTTSELILCMITRAHFLTIIWAGYLSTVGGLSESLGMDTAGSARV